MADGARTMADDRRPGRVQRRSWSRPTTALLVVAVGLTLVALLGSPVRLLALLTPSGPMQPRSVPADPGPDGAAAGSVGEHVTTITGAAPLDAGPAAPSVSSTLDGGDVVGGRWGEALVRPQGAGLLIEELRGGWRVEAGNEEAAALAVIAAHAWADARRPDTSSSIGDGPATGAIVVVEAVERPGAHHAVVTVLVAPDGAAGPLHRIAVPVVIGALGPVLAGMPWPLPAPVLDTLAIVGTPVGDPELIASARRALDVVGLPGDRLVALEATDGWPFIARLDDAAGAHPWLRWHLDRFVVTGLPLVRTGSAPP